MILQWSLFQLHLRKSICSKIILQHFGLICNKSHLKKLWGKWKENCVMKQQLCFPFVLLAQMNRLLCNTANNKKLNLPHKSFWHNCSSMLLSALEIEAFFVNKEALVQPKGWSSRHERPVNDPKKGRHGEVMTTIEHDLFLFFAYFFMSVNAWAVGRGGGDKKNQLMMCLITPLLPANLIWSWSVVRHCWASGPIRTRDLKRQKGRW